MYYRWAADIKFITKKIFQHISIISYILLSQWSFAISPSFLHIFQTCNVPQIHTVPFYYWSTLPLIHTVPFYYWSTLPLIHTVPFYYWSTLPLIHTVPFYYWSTLPLIHTVPFSYWSTLPLIHTVPFYYWSTLPLIHTVPFYYWSTLPLIHTVPFYYWSTLPLIHTVPFYYWSSLPLIHTVPFYYWSTLPLIHTVPFYYWSTLPLIHTVLLAENESEWKRKEGKARLGINLVLKSEWPKMSGDVSLFHIPAWYHVCNLPVVDLFICNWPKCNGYVDLHRLIYIKFTMIGTDRFKYNQDGITRSYDDHDLTPADYRAHLKWVKEHSHLKCDRLWGQSFLVDSL